MENIQALEWALSPGLMVTGLSGTVRVCHRLVPKRKGVTSLSGQPSPTPKHIGGKTPSGLFLSSCDLGVCMCVSIYIDHVSRK